MPVIDKPALLKEITELLVSGEIDMAEDKINENHLSAIESDKITREAYAQLMKNQNISDAIEVCDRFNLSVDMRSQAVHVQFRTYMDKGDYVRAFEWAKKYNLSANDLNSCSLRAFEAALKNGDAKKALAYMEQFEIPLDLATAAAREAFNNFFNRQDFLNAFILGRKFDVSHKRTLTVGIKGYQQLLADGRLSELAEFENEHHILHDGELDDLDEADVTRFVNLFRETVIGSFLAKNKPDDLYAYMDSLNVLNGDDKNPILSKLVFQIRTDVVTAHNSMLSEGRGPAAFDLAKNFKLLESKIPGDLKVAIIRAAEDAHHELLRKNNLNGALFLKNNYELFIDNTLENSLERVTKVTKEFLEESLRKGETADAKKVVSEYEFHETDVIEVVGRVIRELARAGNVLTVIDIIKEMDVKINDQETVAEILMQFNKAYEMNHKDIAARLAHYFHLRESRALRAAVSHWKTLMDEKKIPEALAFRKELRIPKKEIDPLIKDIYYKLKSDISPDEAKKIRQDYKINLSVWEWLLDNVIKLLGGR